MLMIPDIQLMGAAVLSIRPPSKECAPYDTVSCEPAASTTATEPPSVPSVQSNAPATVSRPAPVNTPPENFTLLCIAESVATDSVPPASVNASFDVKLWTESIPEECVIVTLVL